MIRLATQADIPELVEMLIAFQNEARCYSQITPCRESLAVFLGGIISGTFADIAAYEYEGEISGITGIISSPCWFNKNQIVGQELFWYIKPKWRGKYGIAMRMFRWLESWAKEKGLSTLTVASTGTIKVEKIEQFYLRRGYEKWDVLYTKGVE